MQAAASFDSTQSKDPTGKGRIGHFDLVKHALRARKADKPLSALKVSVGNWLTTELMIQASRVTPAVPPHYRPRKGQWKQIEEELHANVPKEKYLRVLLTMPLFGSMRRRDIDFMRDVAAYPEIDYPAYYLQPFHSIPGGYLNPLSAIGNQAAIKALYHRDHPRGGFGMREDIATFVPREAKLVYDFGAGTGDQAALIAGRLGSDAEVHCIEASPFGIIVGRHDYQDTRLKWTLGMVEEQKLAPNTADAINLTFVLHECPDFTKRHILRKAFNTLKPGGTLVWTDPAQDDLVERSRGFYEPYKYEWLRLQPDRELEELGFVDIQLHCVIDPRLVWTRVAKKPL
jgi:SAM-dependent methyltransferase